MPSALIFGSKGQDGYYLERLLQSHQFNTTCVSRSAVSLDQVSIQGDIADRTLVEKLVRKKPDYIFHLAANSSTRDELTSEHQNTIVGGTRNILENVLNFSPASRIFIAGSGLQFVNSGRPITEKDDFVALNGYSQARIEAVHMARHSRSKGIRTYVGYLFHHDSPLRAGRHLNQKIIEAVKNISTGQSSTLTIGDPNVEKEFGYAGDIVEGILQLVQQDNLFEACIGTGKAYPIEKWLEITFSSIGKKWQEHVTIDSNYVADFRRLVSDPSAMKSINWEAKTGIEELARMMLGA